MGTKNEPNDRPALLRALRADWRRWTATVEQFARRAANRCDHDAYVALHARLLAGCVRLAETSAEEAFYRHLAALAQPWLTPGALQAADRDILADLAGRCREAGARLGCWTWWDTLAPSSWLLAVFVAGAAGMTALLHPALEWLREGWREGWRSTRLVTASLADAPWAMPGLALAVVLMAIFLVTRATRS